MSATDQHYDDNQLTEAFARLRISDVAPLVDLPAYQEGKKYLCPFHEEKTPSFNLTANGKAFICHGCHAKGGVWNLVQKAKPGMIKKNIAVLLLEAAGLDPDANKKPAEGKRKSAETRRREALRLEQARYETELHALPTLEPMPEMSYSIAERWQTGVTWAEMDHQRKSKLAAARGWFDFWVKEMVDQELLALPWLPWYDPGERYAAREWAFPLQQPTFDAAGDVLKLTTVGYHQRFTMDKGTKKSWVYVPYTPADSLKAARSSFTAHLHQHRQASTPLPFVCGKINGAKAVIIVEGQWDALTLLAATDFVGLPVMFMGVRGAQGTLPALAAWGRWMQRHRLPVLLLADGDAAGGTWFKTRGDLGARRLPCFADRLEHGLGLTVARRQLRAGPWGKDVNDWYKAKPFALQDVTALLESNGIKF